MKKILAFLALIASCMAVSFFGYGSYGMNNTSFGSGIVLPMQNGTNTLVFANISNAADNGTLQVYYYDSLGRFGIGFLNLSGCVNASNVSQIIGTVNSSAWHSNASYVTGMAYTSGAAASITLADSYGNVLYAIPAGSAYPLANGVLCDREGGCSLTQMVSSSSALSTWQLTLDNVTSWEWMTGVGGVVKDYPTFHLNRWTTIDFYVKASAANTTESLYWEVK